MGWNTLIAKSIAKAFKSAKDLGESVSISVRTADTFDFANPSATPPSLGPVQATLVDLKESRVREGAVQNRKSVLLYSPAISTVDASATLTWSGEEWTVRNVSKSFKNVVMAEIERSL